MREIDVNLLQNSQPRQTLVSGSGIFFSDRFVRFLYPVITRPTSHFHPMVPDYFQKQKYQHRSRNILYLRFHSLFLDGNRTFLRKAIPMEHFINKYHGYIKVE